MNVFQHKIGFIWGDNNCKLGIWAELRFYRDRASQLIDKVVCNVKTKPGAFFVYLLRVIKLTKDLKQIANVLLLNAKPSIIKRQLKHFPQI